MTHVIITTDTADEMKAILALVRRNKLKFKAKTIKEKASILDKTSGTEDWTQPGRPMTDNERDDYFDEIMKQRGGITTAQLAEKQEEWRSKKSFGK